jgi:hypothetical protein
MVNRRRTQKRVNQKEESSLKKNTRKIALDQCSPRKDKENVTCFTRPSLKRIIKYWNQANPNDAIIYSEINSKNELWDKINKKLSSICDNEYCWIEQPFVLNKGDISNDFRPKMPQSWSKNSREWLTTSDIEKVMNQYMNKYDDFVFIGAVPIDFDKEIGAGTCVVNELCKLKLESLLKRGINQIGIVFNLDPHDKPGSHWVSFYGNLKRGELNYFDSYGFKPPSQVKKFVDKMIEQGKYHNMNIKYNYNKKRHQFKDSECGVYSINFIENMLEGKTFNQYCSSNIPDDKMNRLRKKYYLRS